MRDPLADKLGNENARLWSQSVFIGKSVYMTIGGLDVESTRAIERLPSNRVDRQ